MNLTIFLCLYIFISAAILNISDRVNIISVLIFSKPLIFWKFKDRVSVLHSILKHYHLFLLILVSTDYLKLLFPVLIGCLEHLYTPYTVVSFFKGYLKIVYQVKSKFSWKADSRTSVK